MYGPGKTESPPPPYNESQPVTQQPPSSDQNVGTQKDFKYTLCSCLDDIPAVGVSIVALFCPCWSYFMTHRHLEPDTAGGGACSIYILGCAADSCFGSSLTMLSTKNFFYAKIMSMFSCIFVMIPVFMICSQREQIREKFGMPKNSIEDFCLSFCCTFCVMVQNERQVRSAAGELY
ncbi:unnamed protein product [Oikopleura dioica]|uniref:PLAC8 family protein n=1 Tax=Oikopleura dioica TaxID=34765 RepID=E4WWA5_OIKDI|nr:unnamed protein product [Oikopleura dioica]